MRVQRRFTISQDLVVHPVSIGRSQKRVTDRGHIQKKLCALVRRQIVERANHRVRQEQAVTGNKLGISQNRPTWSKPANDLGAKPLFS